jgi:hypothetical protein
VMEYIFDKQNCIYHYIHLKVELNDPKFMDYYNKSVGIFNREKEQLINILDFYKIFS